MIKLAVVIITLNEGKNIKRCIDSVTNLADEIIVLDSYSTDNTKSICSAYSNVKFVERKWEGYSATKNYANSLVESDYILSLDADEALSEELNKSIQEVKRNPEFNFYQLARLTNYCGKWIHHCGWYPDAKVRLFKKEMAKWDGIIHETLTFDKQETVASLKGDLHHYSFYTIDQHIDAVNKFSSLLAKSNFEKGKRTNFFKILFKPGIKFIRDYIFHRGFLDGYMGFVLCKNSAHYAFLKEVKLKQLMNQ